VHFLSPSFKIPLLTYPPLAPRIASNIISKTLTRTSTLQSDFQRAGWNVV
jgi:hypothetical protein